MLLDMVKVCLHLKIILLFRIFENFVLLIYEYKSNEKSSFTNRTFYAFVFQGLLYTSQSTCIRGGVQIGSSTTNRVLYALRTGLGYSCFPTEQQLIN